MFGLLCDSLEILNSSVTLSLAILFPNFIVCSILAAFGIIKELFHKSPESDVTLFVNIFYLLNYTINIIVACRQGSALSDEAESTLNIVSSQMSHLELCNDQKIDFVVLTSHMRLRNLKVRNFLFTINWNTFLTVSSFHALIEIYNKIFFQLISSVITYLVVTCQFGSGEVAKVE
jgi:hypothetical protein